MEQKVTNQIQMESSVTKPQVEAIVERVKKEKEELQKKLQEEALKREEAAKAEAAKAEFYNPKLGEPHKTKVWKAGMEAYAKGEKVKIVRFIKENGRYLVETSKGVKKVFAANELSSNSD